MSQTLSNYGSSSLIKFESLIEKITNDFIVAWNSREMDTLASFLSNDIKLHSPNIKKLFPEVNNSTLYNKIDCMNYWRTLNKDYYFKMTLLRMSKQDKVIDVVIDFGSSDELLFARFAIDEYGKFIDVNITYRSDDH